MPFLDDLLLFVLGAAAAFMNVGAGGGSTLTLPALIFLGLDSATANGTNRIAVIFQNVSAVYSFKRENFHHFDFSLKLSLLTLPGSIIGALVAINTGDETFQKILGVIMILVIISMLIPVKKNNNALPQYKITLPVIIAMTFIGFYGGFLQVGIGFILMAALRYTIKLDLIRINMHKVFIVLLLTLPAFLIFVINGNVDWHYGISLGLGNALGGWWAAKLQVRKGEKVIKIILIAAVLTMALKLLDII